jgi:hypothetical protein
MRDSEGIEHTAEVAADSLCEAIALGLTAIRKSSWVEDIAANLVVRDYDPKSSQRDSWAPNYKVVIEVHTIAAILI